MHVSPARHIVMCDYQESVTNRQIVGRTDRCQTKWSKQISLYGAIIKLTKHMRSNYLKWQVFLKSRLSIDTCIMVSTLEKYGLPNSHTECVLQSIKLIMRITLNNCTCRRRFTRPLHQQNMFLTKHNRDHCGNIHVHVHLQCASAAWKYFSLIAHYLSDCDIFPFLQAFESEVTSLPWLTSPVIPQQKGTVNHLLFASVLFSGYSRGRSFHEYKTPWISTGQGIAKVKRHKQKTVYSIQWNILVFSVHFFHMVHSISMKVDIHV